MPPEFESHLLQNAFQTAAIGMALVSLDEKFLHVNDAICELLGYSADEFFSLSYSDLRVPAVEEIRIAAPQPEVDLVRTEERFLHKKGHAVWVSLSSSIVRDTVGQPKCFFVQLQDITVQKEAELVRDSFFQLPVALHFVAGFDGFFKQLSASWEPALGYSVEDLLATPYIDLIHPDDRESTIAAAQQLEHGEHVFLFENRYRRKDGSYRWLLWAAVSGTGSGTIYGVALDYTARKEMELQLEATLHEMERLVTELKTSHDDIDTLRKGLVTICAWTKRVQHEGRWMTVDEFLSQHLRLKLTHGISAEGMAQALANLKEMQEKSE